MNEHEEEMNDLDNQMLKWRSKANMRAAKIEHIIVELREAADKQSIMDMQTSIHNLLKEIT